MKCFLAAALIVLPIVTVAAEEEAPAPRKAHAADPFEGWNRGVFTFNDKVDTALLQPVARGYRKVVPEPARKVVGNFFGNVGDAWSAINHLLQGKVQPGLEMTMRVATNSVFGLGGLLDVASEAGLERQEEDLGQTLGRWGFGAGPYLVLPLLGPSSLRDTAALPLDRSASPALAFKHDADRLGLIGLQFVDARARYLDAGELLGQIALDRYSFVRDAYLARRRSLVYDGDPPEAPDEEDDAGSEPVAAPPR